MGIFGGKLKNFARKVGSAFVAAPRFVATIVNKDKKVSDFKLFDPQPLKTSYIEGLKGTGIVGSAGFVGSKAGSLVKSTSIDKEKLPDLGNLFSNTGSISNILKNKNLTDFAGIDLGKLFGGGTQSNKPIDIGGGIEFGNTSKKNLLLPFAIIAAVVLAIFALRK
jgi:hypothetical protein